MQPSPPKGDLLDAVNMLCVERRHHPIRDYLDDLKWDGVRRVETWLATYLGADDTELNRAIGTIMLVAAVRRVRQPGVKFDTMMVLEDPQGSGKSTAIQILSGPDNFSDQNVLALDDKAQMEAIEGVRLFEIAELDGVRHAETAKIKSFLSRSEDRGRPAYARFKERWPRRCVFIGTTNDEFYLKDQTGNRRFWPVKTGVIDLGALRRDRDQIWAEAARLEADEHPIVLPRALWAAAAEAQAERLLVDPFEDPLSKLRGRRSGGVDQVHTDEIFAQLEMPMAQRKSHHHKQIAAVMRRLGWTGPKKVRVNGVVARGYERPSAPSGADDDAAF